MLHTSIMPLQPAAAALEKAALGAAGACSTDKEQHPAVAATSSTCSRSQQQHPPLAASAATAIEKLQPRLLIEGALIKIMLLAAPSPHSTPAPPTSMRSLLPYQCCCCLRVLGWASLLQHCQCWRRLQRCYPPRRPPAQRQQRARCGCLAPARLPQKPRSATIKHARACDQGWQHHMHLLVCGLRPAMMCNLGLYQPEHLASLH